MIKLIKNSNRKRDILMKYVGSKNRIAKEIVPIIQKYIDQINAESYLEPFVGGANIIDKIKCNKRIGVDIHKELIELLRYIQNPSHEIPTQITEDEYINVKNNKNNYEDWYVGYVGFQLSYGGKWFGGYRRDKSGKRNYSTEAYNNTIKQIPNIQDVKFINKSFLDLPLDKIHNYVIYCDIPYKGTTKYSTDKFPYEQFYNWCKIASKDNIVLISEYDMPDDFICIWGKEVKVLLDSNKSNNDDNNIRTEKLFIYKDGLAASLK